MGGPTAWVTIEFPVAAIDEEIKGLLEDLYVKFDGLTPIENGRNEEPGTEIEDGIFNLHDSDVNDGEFPVLEAKLKEKGIPFDRQTGMDWGISPCTRIYRPGPPEFDHYYPQDDDGEMVVSVEKIWELLATKSRFRGGSDAEAAANAIFKYLDAHFPLYPPLSDYVKEASNG